MLHVFADTDRIDAHLIVPAREIVVTSRTAAALGADGTAGALRVGVAALLCRNAGLAVGCIETAPLVTIHVRKAAFRASLEDAGVRRVAVTVVNARAGAGALSALAQPRDDLAARDKSQHRERGQPWTTPMRPQVAAKKPQLACRVNASKSTRLVSPAAFNQMDPGESGHGRAMPNSSAASLVILSALVTGLAACSVDAGPGLGAAGSPSGGAAQAGSTTGGNATAGGASAGMATVAGGGASTGGSSAGASTGGSAGMVTGGAPAGGMGGTGGASGGSGGSGFGGFSGASFWGPGGPKKQFTCPAGPFPAQQMGQQTNICDSAGFKYNYGYNEGPTWIASQNAFFFSNFKQGMSDGGDIIKYTLGGACEVWLHDVGCNGLGVSPSGNLLGACHGPRAVMEYNVMTKEGRMVATMAGGKMLDSPNDLIARSDGNVYFSNTTYELGNRPQGLGSALVRVDPMGVTSVIQMGGINGVALSPDETKLHVVQMGTWALDAAGLPGAKGGANPGGDGIAVDCAGTISNNGTNSAFGGPDGKTLLMVGGGTAAKTAVMTVPGLP